MSHLAERLGVSKATLSLALRNSPLVADATHERVKREAEAAGYIYNRSAAALRTARSNVVGVAVHDILNPYFAEIFGALENTLGENDQIVFICNHRDDVERQRTFVQALLQHRADGLVLCPWVGTDPAEINHLVDADFLVTLICRDVEGTRAGHSRRRHHGYAQCGASPDRRRASPYRLSRRAAQIRDRHDGWVSALREAGIDPGTHRFICLK
ncbi:LacI family DNA-binding transcriptional regulator [Breoghania sp.]|uniref:LacI family DNA-binding transcriptional regulator n=1 Tax=Breoghania sp. TaxID=2065378 RepID=UPI00260D2500|nr:LacI family DNA-binding transcriptional regulator [Breoghania sp.]MDJ0933610.1 LacI family DNA-binding transcriptional regulator [Breoghania sp.]